MLDQHDIPFRKSKSEWIMLFGSVAPQSPSDIYRDCRLPIGNNLIDGLEVQVGFSYLPTDDMTTVPNRLTASYQKYDNAYDNLDFVTTQLTSLLGPGHKFAHNHVGSDWAMGRAYVSVHIHPPELNEPYLSGEPYKSQPKLITQCHISITPEWYFEGPDDAVSQLQNYEPWFVCLPEFRPLGGSNNNQYLWPEKIEMPPRGFGVLGSQYVVVVDYSPLFHLIEVRQITQVKMTGRFAARCGADCRLVLYYAVPSGQTAKVDLVPIHMGNESYYEDLGERLAKYLGVEFDTEFYPSE